MKKKWKNAPPNVDELIPRDGAPALYYPKPGQGLRFRRTRTSGAKVDNRTTWIINTPVEDRYHTVIPPENGDIDAYRLNPVVLVNHNPWLIAGNSTISRDSGTITANMRDGDRAEGGDWALHNPDIEVFYQNVVKGIMRAASIGFRAKWEKQLIDPEGDPWDWENIIWTAVSWELLEWSIVTIPGNPEAVVTDAMMTPDQRSLFGHILGSRARSYVVPGIPEGERIDDAPTERSSAGPTGSEASASEPVMADEPVRGGKASPHGGAGERASVVDHEVKGQAAERVVLTEAHVRALRKRRLLRIRKEILFVQGKIARK